MTNQEKKHEELMSLVDKCPILNNIYKLHEAVKKQERKVVLFKKFIKGKKLGVIANDK